MDDSMFALLESRGWPIAVALLAANAVLLPARDRKRLLLPGVVLLLATLCLTPWHVQALAGLRTAALQYVVLCLLLYCLCRLGFLLLVSARPQRALFASTPKIILDLCQAIILATGFFFALHLMGVEASSLVTGSAMLTVVIGLMTKDMLANVFSGLAIQAERPFGIGDWIQYDAEKSHMGKVLEINWRATKLLTLDQAAITVPNGLLAQTAIVVYTRPTPISRRSIYFAAPYHVAPQEVHRIVMEAIADMPMIVKTPVPNIVTFDFSERGIQYWLRIFTTELDIRDRVDGEARDRIWYAFQRHGITMPRLQHSVRLDHVDTRQPTHHRSRRLRACVRALQSVDFFRQLPQPALGQLASRVRRKLYAAGELLMREGETGSELFIVKAGQLAIVKKTPAGETIEIDRVSSPGFVGEMSLLTGAPRSASVKAIQPTRCYVVDKEALSRVLNESPELAAAISEVIAQRHQHQADTMVAASAAASNGEPGDLLDRIRDFFRLRLL
ncbi:MAG: mechanosensitive ion channel [Planctomycetes bacterium]|nr:mechanosensitive ion channel [Planctomycetota bacterium]